MKDRTKTRLIYLHGQRQLRRLKGMGWNTPLFSTVLPMGTVLALVMLSQAWANSLSGPSFFGLIGLMPQQDASYFFGTIHTIPIPLIKAISLTAAGFALFLYAVVQWAIPTPSPLIRTGLSWMIGAGLGAAANRAMDGYIESYFVLGLPHLHSPPLNLGDIFILMGAAIAVAGGWINTVSHSMEHSQRGGFWVNPKFQLRYCGILIAVGGAFSAVIGGCGYLFLQMALEQGGVLKNSSADSVYLQEVVRSFGVMAVILSACFLATLAFIGVVHSHRIAGPLYAFERFFEDLLNGKKRRLKLRDGDEFPQLERIAQELSNRFGESNKPAAARPVLRAVPNEPAKTDDDREAA